MSIASSVQVSLALSALAATLMLRLGLETLGASLKGPALASVSIRDSDYKAI